MEIIKLNEILGALSLCDSSVDVQVIGKGESTVVAVKMLKEDHTENELLGLVKEVEIMKVG